MNDFQSLGICVVIAIAFIFSSGLIACVLVDVREAIEKLTKAVKEAGEKK